ncbi:MAG: 30S ribosomal protein S18 [Deltaproteobacteria bacterium]|nr:30S ribosomal protein S18 [Deltaproteobacteria bacterium]
MRMMRERDQRDTKEKGKGKGPKRRPVARRRQCRICADNKIRVDYKDTRLLQQFLSERGRIVPRRVSGNCAHHQRAVNLAIKRARILAFIPFTSTQQL